MLNFLLHEAPGGAFADERERPEARTSYDERDGDRRFSVNPEVCDGPVIETQDAHCPRAARNSLLEGSLPRTNSPGDTAVFRGTGAEREGSVPWIGVSEGDDAQQTVVPLEEVNHAPVCQALDDHARDPLDELSLVE